MTPGFTSWGRLLLFFWFRKLGQLDESAGVIKADLEKSGVAVDSTLTRLKGHERNTIMPQSHLMQPYQ